MRAPSPIPTTVPPAAGWPAERPGTAPLRAAEAHAWRAELDLDRARQAELEGLLSPEEADRIARIRPPLARRRLAAGRGILREIVGAYLGVDPRDLRFATGAWGKPRLAPVATTGGEALHFNLSHSEGLALVSLARGSRVGVDLEAVRPVPSAAALARRFFTERERAAFESAPEEERARLFLLAWTRKEACVKALGLGFWEAGRRFEVSGAPDEPARVVAVDGDAGAAHGWSLLHLSPAPGWVGALAVEGPLRAVRTRRLASRAGGGAPGVETG